MKYTAIRNLYYFGILVLVIYALPTIVFIKETIHPLLEFEFVPGIQIITIIALATAIAAFTAYKYRKIG